MVVVDSSVLIPLARAGNLDLIDQVFDQARTVEEVYAETVERGGKPGASEIKQAFDSWMETEQVDGSSEEVAELEGLTRVDARLVLLAEENDEVLLTNDRVIVNVAKARGVETYWAATLLLKAVKEGELTTGEGKELLYDLVGAGMNLDNKVYSRLLRKIEELG